MQEQPDLRTWDAWHLTHQPFELQWWKDHLANGHSLDDAEFLKVWSEVREFIKPYGVVLDIGCGPRPPFAPCIAIEPLALEYRKLVPPEWWYGVEVHAHPAEFLIDKLHANTVICWNCIDHTIGWCAILDNMLAYGDKRTRYALATDFWEPFVGHPGFERQQFMAEVEKRFEIIDKREPFGRELALIMIKR